MGWLDRLRGWIWRTEERSNKLEYRALDTVHHAEDAVDHATHGRLYHALDRADEGAEEILEGIGLDEEDEEKPPPPARPAG
jgi:hypothetical protein